MSESGDRRRTANLFLRFRKRSQRRGWSGRLYNLGERFAPVTRSSPLRRCVQLVCLGLFLFAFFYICWPYSTSFDQTTFTARETFKVELFLLLDPLVGVSTLLAGQYANWATFVWTIGILAACLLVPRGFCGYLCPLGTLIDLFDWLIGRHFRRFHLVKDIAQGGWVHFKYYLLIAVLVSSLSGVLLSGFFAAIPVLTRGMMFTGARVQLAALKGEGQLAPVDAAFYLSVALFFAVFALSLLGRRFWCRYVCPSGALLSVGNFLRIGERKVTDDCIHCNRCIEICPFDAIKEDFTTRTSDCTYCQTCGGVCPPQAIQFASRWHREDLKEENDPPVTARPLSRRSFVAATAAAAVTAVAVRTVDGLAVSRERGNPLRPPGSVPEDDFLDLCIRCGQCFKVCPGPVLHPAGLDYGWENLWTPVAQLDHAGCHQDCSFCTLVCPTGAIQPLEIGVKRKVHMGLAKVDAQTCLPFRAEERRDCDLCYSECKQAGYDAIEMRAIQIELDLPPPEGMFSDMELLEMSRIRAPFVDADACVGCGICQYRCFTTYVKQQEELRQSAIVVSAENEHRLRAFPMKAEGLPLPTDLTYGG